MVFHCQRDYEHIPYPSEANPKSSLKSSGCGVCSASMIVENMTDVKWHPIELCEFSLKCGGRDNFGTDMTKLGPAFAEKVGLKYDITNNIETVLTHLNDGGMVIANVGGNYSGHTGVFSSGGHYIVLVKTFEDKVVILDPDKYDGKFERDGRHGKVEIDGDMLTCTVETLVCDCANREPAYYLFGK